MRRLLAPTKIQDTKKCFGCTMENETKNLNFHPKETKYYCVWAGLMIMIIDQLKPSINTKYFFVFYFWSLTPNPPQHCPITML